MCMRLRSDSISKDYPSSTKRIYTIMMNSRNNKNGEQTSNTTGEGIVDASLTEAIASTTNTKTIPSTAQSGVIFSPSIAQSHYVTPRPTVASDFRPYMSSFIMPMTGREQPYGLPRSVMASLPTNASIFVGNAVITYSPL